MNVYLVQYVFTPSGVAIDTIVSAENQRLATYKGRLKIADKLNIPVTRARKLLRWKATSPISRQGKLFAPTPEKP